MAQMLGFYVNLEKCEIAAQLVKHYGEYLQDMPLEERRIRLTLLFFRDSL